MLDRNEGRIGYRNNLGDCVGYGIYNLRLGSYDRDLGSASAGWMGRLV